MFALKSRWTFIEYDGGGDAWLVESDQNRRGKHGLAAFTVGYRVGVGDLRRLPQPIHCGAKGTEQRLTRNKSPWLAKWENWNEFRFATAIQLRANF